MSRDDFDDLRAGESFESWLTRTGRRPARPDRHADAVRAKARKAGLHPSTVQERLARGWTLERALSEPVDRKRRPGSTGLAAKARAAGIPRTTVNARLRRGWTLERALSEPVQPQQHKRRGERNGALKAAPTPR